MNKLAQQTNLLLKLAAVVGNPASDPELVRIAREYVEKNAGMFDSISDMGSSALAGLGDMGSSAMSGIGNMANSFGNAASSFGSSMSGLASSVMSNLQLPFGVTLESVANKLCASDPEMAQMRNDPSFLDALKQALSSVSQDDIKAMIS